MKINELTDGTRGRFTFLLSSLTKGVTSKGATYLSCVLQDKTGSIDAKYWSPSSEEVNTLKPGMILEIDGEVLNYNKQLQMKINAVKVIDRSQINLSDFIKECHLPAKLGELKSRVEITPEILRKVADSCNIIKCNPRELTRDEVYEILLECM